MYNVIINIDCVWSITVSSRKLNLHCYVLLFSVHNQVAEKMNLIEMYKMEKERRQKVNIMRRMTVLSYP